MTGSPSCNHLYVLKDPCPCTSPVVLLLRDTWTLHSSCHCGCQRCIVCLLLAGSSVVRGQTEGKGSKQKQREKKDSRTTSYTIHNVYVFEKLCQLLAMKILEKKQWFWIVLNTLVKYSLLPISKTSELTIWLIKAMWQVKAFWLNILKFLSWQDSVIVRNKTKPQILPWSAMMVI